MGKVTSRLSKMSIKVKVILVLVLVAVVSIGWYSAALRSDERVTKVFSTMPLGAVQVINDAGEPVLLWVKVADTPDARKAGFSGVGETIVQQTALYYIYLRDTTERHGVTGVRVPLEIGFFQADGTLVSIARTSVSASTTYGAPTRVNYRYAIMGPQGFFSKHGISVEGGAKLLHETLLRAPAWR